MRTLRGYGGFTLLELLVALAVFGAVMVGAFTLYAANQRALRRGQLEAGIQQNARVALQAATREIRVAGYDLSGVLTTLSSPTPIQVAEADRVTFVADVNRDGVLDRVSYGIQNGRLVRAFSSWDGSAFPAAASGVLADGLSSLSFSYFDDTTPTNTVLATPVASSSLGSIRRIRLGIVTSDAAAGEGESFSVLADVRLRN